MPKSRGKFSVAPRELGRRPLHALHRTIHGKMSVAVDTQEIKLMIAAIYAGTIAPWAEG